ALAKILRVLPAELRERVVALEEGLTTMWSSSGASPPSTRVALDIAQAIRTRRRVRIRYATPGRPERDRIVAPYGMVFFSRRWYLAANDDRSNAVRTFRVDRVRDAELRSETFTIPDGFDAAAHVARSIAEAPWGTEIEVVFRTTLEEARRRIPRTI